MVSNYNFFQETKASINRLFSCKPHKPIIFSALQRMSFRWVTEMLVCLVRLLFAPYMRILQNLVLISQGEKFLTER
jgi:hypothetical protein